MKSIFFNKSLRKLSEFLKPKNDKSYDKIEVVFIKNKSGDLKTDIKYMHENEVKNKKPDSIVGLVKKILDIYGLLNVPDLKSAAQKGQGLNKLTPKQMITILPILLAQLKAASNSSEKLKNEIRHLLYSLCRSKNLSKTIYNHLINNI